MTPLGQYSRACRVIGVHAHARSCASWCIALVIALACPVQPAARAQSQAKILVLARTAADSVVLRWAPDTPHGWRIGNRLGYRVQRSTAAGESTVLTPVPLRAVNPETVEARLQDGEHNRFLAIAMLAAWGDSTLAGEADSLGLDTLAANTDNNTQMYGYALFAADNAPDVATLLGLRFVDRTVRAGETYTYTVSLAEPCDYRIDPGRVTVSARADAATHPAPRDLTAQGLDSRIELAWHAPGGAACSGWHVQRSADGGRSFVQLTDVPRVMIETDSMPLPTIGSFIDTTVVNGRVYRYRVRGIDAFGMPGEAAEVEARAVDLTPPPAPVVKRPEQIGLDRIRIAWEYPDAPADLAGFHILRSAKSDAGFVRITRQPIARTARTWDDVHPDDAARFYIVSAVDASGNEARSVSIYGFIVDTTRPEPPRNLAATIDTNGIVRLHWNPVPGRNISGYRVQRANALEHEFSQITGEVVHDTSYVDTIVVRTLTRNVYYRVASVSRTFRHSEPGPVLELARPDLIPPSQALFTDVFVDLTRVRLSWAASVSDDVAEQVLLRSSARDTAWRPIARLKPRVESYVDSTGETGLTYFYHIETVDLSGWRSRTDVPAHARPFDSGVRPPVTDVRAVYDSAKSTVTLTWLYTPRAGEKPRFIVYREAGGYDLSPYASAPAGTVRYVDTDLRARGPYMYRIKVQSSGGSESVLSAPVMVIVPR